MLKGREKKNRQKGDKYRWSHRCLAVSFSFVAGEFSDDVTTNLNGSLKG